MQNIQDAVKGEISNSSNTLHISNIPFDTKEEDLFYFFKDYNVQSIKISR
jgi:RNA recognition motif-containing protein